MVRARDGESARGPSVESVHAPCVSSRGTRAAAAGGAAPEKNRGSPSKGPPRERGGEGARELHRAVFVVVDAPYTRSHADDTPPSGAAGSIRDCGAGAIVNWR
eukprot:COSAG02_NODE_4142_length_5722_cov_21.915526_5_plen_103_part_00